MIYTRYLAVNIFKGTALVLMVLVFLSLFLTLIPQIDDLGKGEFGPWQLIQYQLLQAPSMMVQYLPLATLIGSILSLGGLAANSELIAFQSSGITVNKFILAVIQAAFLLALISILLLNFVVPFSETSAKEIKTSSIASRVSMQFRTGVWIKDGSNLIYIKRLFPNGNAQNIEIYHLDENNNLLATTIAKKSIITDQGWLLQRVKKTILTNNKIIVEQKKQRLYSGKLSDQLLKSLVVNPRQMSTLDLYSYISFLNENKLNHAAESLLMWQKIYAPLTVIVMAVLAIPFVLGSQRNSNAGLRILTGILLGLVYVIMDRVLIQLGMQLKLVPFVNALIPTLLFMVFTAYLIRRKIR